MATVKKLNSTYTIDTSDVIILGNLIVSGTYDTQTVTNTNIIDKDIVLNAGESGWGVGGNASPGTSGITIDRGLQANVSIQWSETAGKWQLTNDGLTFSNIFASATGVTNVVDDVNPYLGGNLKTNGFNIQFFPTTLGTPGVISGNTIMYASSIGIGGSGLYVVNDITASEELITKGRAFGFSLFL